jgi:hypothetical protein
MKYFVGIAALSLMAAAHSGAARAQTPDAAPPAADIRTASGYVREAWNDFSRCRRASACNTYFDTFGVALPFADGSVAPFAHMQRLEATSRDCIKTAKAHLEQGDKSLAVQWVMAARVENKKILDWLGSHPDAVLEALRRCCS